MLQLKYLELSKIIINIIRNSSEVYGFVFFFCGLSAFTGPFVIKFVIGHSIDKNLFHIVFWIGSLLQFICIIILLCFSEEKFQYKKNTNEKVDTKGIKFICPDSTINSNKSKKYNFN